MVPEASRPEAERRAIELVLEAEQRAEDVVAAAQFEAEQILAAARERCQRIHRLADQRISRIHSWCGESTEGAVAALKRAHQQRESAQFANRDDTPRVERAVTRVANWILGDAHRVRDAKGGGA